ncbi:MAG TPA: DeoR/GlpR transcriptional regulator, partial [Spirochaetales bacterium]|nr:DeoR/GlpR transcriptional regulator [Spirochaetales bacterium]
MLVIILTLLILRLRITCLVVEPLFISRVSPASTSFAAARPIASFSSGFIPADRQKRIQRLLQERGVVKVTDLSSLLGVSEITIRRDLDVLE